jgi:hypothetical protein
MGTQKKKFRRKYKEFCKLEKECKELGIYEKAFPKDARKLFDKQMNKQVLKVESFNSRKNVIENVYQQKESEYEQLKKGLDCLEKHIS